MCFLALVPAMYTTTAPSRGDPGFDSSVRDSRHRACELETGVAAQVLRAVATRAGSQWRMSQKLQREVVLVEAVPCLQKLARVGPAHFPSVFTKRSQCEVAVRARAMVRGGMAAWFSVWTAVLELARVTQEPQCKFEVVSQF